MGNQCKPNPAASPPPPPSNHRRDTFADDDYVACRESRIPMLSPAKNPSRKRFFMSFTAINSPARSTLSSTSASETPPYRDIIKTASSLSLNRHPSASPMIDHLHRPSSEDTVDDDDDKENGFLSEVEPYYLGNSRDEYNSNKSSFGVEEDFRQISKRFRTKRFRSRLELGIM